jgi:acylphosphatase
MAAIKHCNITVYGTVQGVGFRYAAQKKARELGVCGFARNEPNGAVYLEAEGAGERVAEFIEWCRIGHGFAEVNKVDIEYGEIVGYEGFNIVLETIVQ